MGGALLLQLPLHPATAWEPTGNIPLAPASIAAAAGLPRDSVLPGHMLDSLGDAALLEELLNRRPDVIGVTLYLWNRARTLNLLREYRKFHRGVMVVAGGPEVTADNSRLLDESCIDLFVAGEGESRASEVLCEGSLRTILESGTRFLPALAETAPPHRWPDPYETGHLIPVPGGSVHIETQRGCGCLCSYCAYRRTSPVPRITPAAAALGKMRMLREKGAAEFVFLDPTFNSRNDLETLLAGMRGLNAECFAEVRGDLVTESQAASIREAGFSSMEVGLQTMSREVLQAVGRGGDPENILRGASFLAGEGVIPVVDLILGLPGDRPENVELGAERLLAGEIADQVQTFCLSVLPGTALRAEAELLGISYADRPPYTVTRSGNHSLGDLMEARERISNTLGYDPDPPRRPVLCDDFPGMEVFDADSPLEKPPVSLRHGVLRIRSRDPWSTRRAIMEKIIQRRRIDPYCPLEVTIETGREFPLDLLDDIVSLREPECYEREKSAVYGVDSLVRTAVIAGRNFDADWLAECSLNTVTVVRSSEAAALPGGRTGLLLEGRYDLPKLSALYGNAPELVFFRDFDLERLWNLEILELG